MLKWLSVKIDGKSDVRSTPVAYVIDENCTACGTCKDVCPVEAINEGEPIYTINPDTCIDCGQCADACPVDAIHPQ